MLRTDIGRRYRLRRITKNTRNTTSRKPTIFRRFTDNHRSAPEEGPLTQICTAHDRIGGIRRAGPNVASR